MYKKCRKYVDMTERTILHVDINSCFASIETALEPSLKGHPIAVCGSVEDRHGIVLAKSEEAKRFGVRTAETVWQAKRKCPSLITVPPHYSEYLRYSGAARRIYEDFTDQVEPFGLDECWLDVTGSTKLFGSGEAIAQTIRKRVKSELDITVSVGVSFGRIFSKLGSDMKKPDAVTVLRKENYLEKAGNLPAGALMGVGKSTENLLNRRGIYTILDLVLAKEDVLCSLLGKNGSALWRSLRGEEAPISVNEQRAAHKSISSGITTGRDMMNYDEACNVLLALSRDVAIRLRKEGVFARGVQIAVRRTEGLQWQQYGRQLEFATQSAGGIYECARELMKLYEWECPLRSLCVRATELGGEKYVQENMLGDIERHEKRERVSAAVYDICRKFGKEAVKPAAMLSCPVPGCGERINCLPDAALRNGGK